MVKYEMLGLAAKYGLSDVREGLSVIRAVSYTHLTLPTIYSV